MKTMIPIRRIFPFAAVTATGLTLALTAAEPASAPAAPTAALTTTATPNTQALELQLPKPQFFGTPKIIKSKNLEKPLAGKRPVYQVPAGTVLLSAGKKVTSSDNAPIIGTLDIVFGEVDR